MAHILYFETMFLKLLEVKRSVCQQEQASQDTYYLIHFEARTKLGLKIRDKKGENVTWGGGKGPKSVTYLLNGP